MACTEDKAAPPEASHDGSAQTLSIAPSQDRDIVKIIVARAYTQPRPEARETRSILEDMIPEHAMALALHVGGVRHNYGIDEAAISCVMYTWTLKTLERQYIALTA